MIVKARSLSKLYKTPSKLEILKGVTFTLQKGQSMAIIGPSGVGKSTLLHILGTLETPSSGTLEILGKNSLTEWSPALRNQHLGFVFQNFNLLEESSALENVLMPARIGRRKSSQGSDACDHAEQMLDRVGLTPHKNQQVKSLSGGEKQRVAIARALCNQPDLILADEPSGNLDQENGQLVHQLLISAVRDFGQSLIVVTHSTKLAKLCDQVYLLKEGVLTSI